MDEIKYLYTDGSFNFKNKRMGCGVVIVKNNTVIKEIYKGYTNKMYAKQEGNASEILAVMLAMQYAKKEGYKKICICYDCNSVVYNLSTPEKISKKMIIEYRKLYSDIKKEMDIQFKKVKAHSSNEFNNRADKLARKGRKT